MIDNLQAPWIGFPPDWKEEPEIVGYCDCCGHPIYEDDDYINDCGTLYCSFCFER